MKTLNRALKLCGEDRIVGASETAITVLEYNVDNDIRRATGTTKPTDGDAGYEKGCLFMDTDAAAGSVLYTNDGTTSSCDFSLGVTGDVTNVIAGAGMTGGGDTGAVTLNVIGGTGITVAANAVAVTTAGVTRALMSAPAGTQAIQGESATIATTGTISKYLVVNQAGTLASVSVTPLVALTKSDSNYITWTITNLGQAGSGDTVMLAATAPNTTKDTGGTALAISTIRPLTVHATGGNLTVAAGDLLRIDAAVTGTLANTVTVPVYILRFTGTT